MAPYSFFGRLVGVAYLTSHAFEPLSIVSLNLRFHWRQRAWYLGPWNEQRGGRVYDCSLSPKERITSRGKVIWLCCHHEMVQRLRRDLPSSIWIRGYNRWSNENYFIVEVTYFFFNTNFVQRFCCFKKYNEIPVLAISYLRYNKFRLQRHGVFFTWRELMYMHNRGHKAILLSFGWVCLLAFFTSFQFS